MSPGFDPRPVVLATEAVRLEPLAPAHADALLAAGGDADTWRYLPRGRLTGAADARSWIDDICAEVADGHRVAFCIINTRQEIVVGSTSYLDIQRDHRGLEIGWTWLGPSARRTHVNTHCKWLLLSHAFDTLGAMRVQFKTDRRNHASRQALLRIGASYEGTLRKHRLLPDGDVRDSAYFSIIDTDWTGGVRGNLREMIET